MDQFSRNAARAAQAIQHEIATALGPPEEGRQAGNINAIVPSILFRQSRGYLVKIANQANGAYSSGWYDAAAVMIRRLLETLIIEAFEKNGRASEIQNADGDFYYLRDLVAQTIVSSAWNLSRNTKRALPKLKDVGDKSAHSRRFNAVKNDLESIRGDLRVVVEELLSLAGMR
ncbi:DUF4145 domain-containing protein [Tsuneonella amylolytica]|uniref:DUF4145 domain-containing protein n=1 Tax=Tsuneonella amylolytica TaxID=2338327 RepID=UPI0018F8AC5E|nr:DUF4145 domain-containing protein [Tsuneonella amylolytica]